MASLAPPFSFTWFASYLPRRLSTQRLPILRGSSQFPGPLTWGPSWPHVSLVCYIQSMSQNGCFFLLAPYHVPKYYCVSRPFLKLFNKYLRNIYYTHFISGTRVRTALMGVQGRVVGRMCTPAREPCHPTVTDANAGAIPPGLASWLFHLLSVWGWVLMEFLGTSVFSFITMGTMTSHGYERIW